VLSSPLLERQDKTTNSNLPRGVGTTPVLDSIGPFILKVIAILHGSPYIQNIHPHNTRYYNKTP
jgi:hypothetical protein